MYPQPVRLRHPIPATPPTRLSPALEWDVLRLTPFILSALLLFSLAGCATARNYLDPDRPLYEGAFARPSSAAAGEPSAIRVVTFNIERGARAREAAELLRSRPELAGADVVLLQEMRAPGVEEMARALSLNYVYYPVWVTLRLDGDQMS